MAVATANPNLLTDGDAAFLRVDNGRPAHALEPGVYASATNKRSEKGQAGPRFGCGHDAWGRPAHVILMPRTQSFPPRTPPAVISSIHVALTVGRTYRYVMGANEVSAVVTTDQGQLELCVPSGGAGSGTFVAGSTGFNLFGTPEQPITALMLVEGVKTVGYGRFSDQTTDTDNGILLTDDWRDGTTEDGGRGRAWRILSNNGPQAIPLNGHSLWDTARLIQCHNAVVLLRHGNQRYYFSAKNVDDALNDRITLPGPVSWGATTAQRVRFELAQDGSAIYGATQSITDTDATADTITIVAHGLTNGDAKIVTGLTGVSGVKYVRSVTTDTLSLYDTAAHAIAGGGTGKVNLTVDDETGTVADNPPAAGNYYYAKLVSGQIIELYQDVALTNKILFTNTPAPVGRFYFELATDPIPFFGNGPTPLILQPGPVTTAFDNGFVAVTANVEITDTTDTIVTAPNHRFKEGDAVSQTGLTIGTGGPYFAFPRSDHTLTLHTNQTEALTGLNPVTTITVAGTGTIKKTSAAGLPMPPGREGAYLNGRLWIINQDDELLQSDPFDFLHFTRFVGQAPANQGEAGRANWLAPLGEDVIAIGKNQKVIGLSGISGAPSTWKEGTITSEYGGIAPMAKVQSGSDLQFASRKGWSSAVRTIAGERLGVARTVSHSIPEDLQDIDWTQAAIMCAETWNGRLFWAVPTKGQTTVVNNKVLVLNRNNQLLYLEQQVVAGEIVGAVREYAEGSGGPDSWEGAWTGELLTPYAFAKLTVNGEERLTWATPDGIVCWFHDGWDDNGAAIADELVTRGYFGREVLALKGSFRWETFDPKLSAYVRTSGVNEEAALSGFDELQYDRTKYVLAGATDYNPATSTEAQFDAPHRADYSPTPEEVTVARLDVHQASTESFRCRVRDHSVQFRIVNAQGSARLTGVTVQAAMAGNSATRKT